MHLEPQAPQGAYRVASPEPGEANGLGGTTPSSTLPWATPWRVVMAGANAASIVDSTLMDLARRKGERWYLGGIGGDATARDLRVNLSFLGAGTFSAAIIADGPSDDSFAESARRVTSSDALAVSLRQRGGFVATLARATE
jgi:hypothetical protein